MAPANTPDRWEYIYYQHHTMHQQAEHNPELEQCAVDHIKHITGLERLMANKEIVRLQGPMG